MVALSSLAATSGWLAQNLGWILFFISTGIVMIPSLFLLQNLIKEKE
jgi:hypothetical protein